MKDYSNYHEIDTNEKIMHDGQLMLENMLNGFESYEALLNNEKQVRILLNSKFSTTKEIRTVIGKPSDIERGNVFEIDGHHWLVVTFPEDNKIYRKADAQLCNATFTIQTDSTVEYLKDENGEYILDRFNNPIPIEIDGESISVPVIYESKYTTINENEQLPLPDGRVHITMRYQKADNIKLNKEFVMEGNKYKISDLDYSNKVKDVGTMTIIADRVVDDSGNV